MKRRVSLNEVAYYDSLHGAQTQFSCKSKAIRIKHMLENENLSVLHKLIVFISPRSNVHRNARNSYQTNRLSSHINNLTMISINSHHSKRIDQDKFHHSNFKSRYLAQNLMNFHNLNCIVLYVPRPIRTTWRFQELARLISYLFEDAAAGLLDSRPGS